MVAPIDVFISFVQEDDALRSELEKHLSALTQIRVWSGRHVEVGRDPGEAAAAHLKTAQVILLLVSADYLASEMVWQAELTLALARHKSWEARVIPVIVRPCEWSQAPFARLMPLPSAGKAVTVWPTHDTAWADVARGLLDVIGEIAGPRAKVSKLTPAYQSEAIRKLSEGLEAARERKRALEAAGGSTAEVEQEILALRRQLRAGGQLQAGDSLGDGRYFLLERIGRGGFAIVWRALDRERNEAVAIKVLHSELAGDTIRLERFVRGVRIMAELDHPAVVRVLEPHGEDEGYHYFVMELLTGDLGRAVLSKRIAGEAVLSIVLRIGEALAKAHGKGWVHRDVKPANILLDEAGAPRLADFDLVGGVKTTGGTRTGAMGTAIYAAPELWQRPQDADARADVYGLGMTAVFGLYGEELPLDVVRNAAELIDELSCSAAVKGVLKRAVQWKAAKRFADAATFCKALRAAALPPSSAIIPRDENPYPYLAGIVFLFLAAVGLFVWKSTADSAVDPTTHLSDAGTSDASEIASPSASEIPRPQPPGSCPTGMVLIPEGTFKMGSPEAAGDSDEHPQRDVKLSAFCLDKTEVTVGKYRACTRMARAGPPCNPAPTTVSWPGISPEDVKRWSPYCNAERADRTKHPINCIDWKQASRYCQWTGGRLPSEAEWEYAARGSGSKGRKYPWGSEEPDATRLNACGAECGKAHPDLNPMYPSDDGWPETAPVGTYPKGETPEGLQDMAGNVWEWTADFYAEYTPPDGGVMENPQGLSQPSEADARVARGGAWDDDAPSWVRSAYRFRYRASHRDSRVGFRCARGTSPPSPPLPKGS